MNMAAAEKPAMAMAGDRAQAQKLEVIIARYMAEAKDVMLLELRDARGRALPAFEPGAHVEVSLPNGLTRQYSLLNDCRETDRYVLAVGKAADSRGGSACVHESLTQGAPLQISAPRNNFPLDAAAQSYLFIAGGIGITPIMSMIRWCAANQRPWRLVYAARNRQRAALYEEIQSLGGERVQWHFDDEQGGYLQVADLVQNLAEGEQIYCCGPQALMEAVQDAAATHPPGVAHFEWFSAPKTDAPPAAAGTFEIRLERSGLSFSVPPDKSILEVLEENGFSLPFSCREGTCRTCETGVCAGSPEHFDYVLSSEERAAGKSMMICVSRSVDPVLCLDL
ncbi:PDR/VanB family oxidoreductase [Eoetvoesiella caeni]|uniref:Vanillate O-demethylase ferredoxin subunit n=2 Tax=Eoetvoesiella caeni TaxID=645616 RepID=A0A366HJG1_9BURK|nr:PDR/VanB family oxidoreductase [Eoetvoesiella caeni]MCI2808143.1 PDR/VanB family oxidoreductase [Eoetvoesiella caeni]RBP42066.1 vanillate O-demethylase ferredoxin subunit [Eoetvoesiella caeni]